MSSGTSGRHHPTELLGPALAAAAARRDVLLSDPGLEAVRLLHDRGEELEGLAIDRYGPLVLASAYDPLWTRAEGLEALREAFTGYPLFVRARGRGAGAPSQHGGPPHSGSVWVAEHGLRFQVELLRGANPGLFLDTRPLRAWLRARAGGKRLLNLFSYTCSLGVAAAAGGALQTTNVDIAPAVLARGRLAYEENGLELRAAEFVKGDARKRLQWLRARGRRYGLIVVDPPSVALRRRGGFDAERDYAGLAARCLPLIEPGGLLLFTRNARGSGAEAFREELAPGLPGCTLTEVLGPGADFVPDRASGLTILVYQAPS